MHSRVMNSGGPDGSSKKRVEVGFGERSHHGLGDGVQGAGGGVRMLLEGDLLTANSTRVEGSPLLLGEGWAMRTTPECVCVHVHGCSLCAHVWSLCVACVCMYLCVHVCTWVWSVCMHVHVFVCVRTKS